MGKRRHVPFDVFAMQVDVPVSTMVCDDGYGWTCGQCPLDREGQVVSPGDLVAQTAFVCEMIVSVVKRGGFEKKDVGKLNVYYVEARPGEGGAALDLFRARFQHRPVIVPIRVPHFYYDGMMLEVDVFTGTGAGAPRIGLDGPVGLHIVRTDGLIWASVTGEVAGPDSLPDLLQEISSVLCRAGLGAERLVSDHWFVSGLDGEDLGGTFPECEFVTNPDAVVIAAAAGSNALVGELTFTAASAPVALQVERRKNLNLFTRCDAGGCWVSGVHADANSDLVEQTGAIMSGIARSLEAQGMSFENVVKLTAHYVGGASAEELHGNMTLRHSYYSSPGPASTGLPVSGLLNSGCRISIDVVAIA